MNVKKLKNKLPIENQYDVELHACHNDCIEFAGNSKAECYELQRLTGLDLIDPGDPAIKTATDFAYSMGLNYCYGYHSPSVTSLF